MEIFFKINFCCLNKIKAILVLFFIAFCYYNTSAQVKTRDSDAKPDDDEKESVKDKISFSLGTNVDIADGPKLNSFYGRLSINQPNALANKFIGGSLGIYGSLYQNKYINQENKYDINYYYRLKSIDASGNFEYSKIYGERKETISSNNYGLVLSIPVSYSKLEDTKIKHKFGWTFLEFETIIRKITTASEIDTLNALSIILPYRILSDSLTPNPSVNKTVVDEYWGTFSLHYEYNGEKYSAFIRAIPIGIYWNNEDNVARAYYSYYFSVKENNLGIRIGGELKGLINDRAPFLNLFLTKSINLSEIGKAIKSN